MIAQLTDDRDTQTHCCVDSLFKATSADNRCLLLENGNVKRSHDVSTCCLKQQPICSFFSVIMQSKSVIDILI